MANATLLSWINAEVDQALKLVRDNIARFAAGPQDETALAVCPEHLHQVSGALRMVGLTGATRFCEALEGSFGGLSAVPATPENIGIIDRAVFALREFVADLARGQADVPLKLYPAYRELGQLLGKPDTSEKDLFFPDLGAPAPAHPEAQALPQEELAPYLQAQRSRFQRGLLGWLRGTPGAGLGDMREALEALHRVADQLPEPRALWWVAGGLLECIDEPAAKVLCNRIDFQIRDLVAGADKASEPLLRELLYTLAKSEADTPLLKQIRSLYQLESLFPDAGGHEAGGEMDIEFLEVALYDLHSRLDALKSAWVQYISGAPQAAARVRELAVAFKAKASELRNQHLIKMLDAIALVASRLPDPYPHAQQFMIIEMASAFLLVENVIDHWSSPPEDLDQQIVMMGGWLLDAAKGKSSGEPPAGLRADITQQIGVLQLRAHVAKEITTNLQNVEQTLDAFARDPAKRDTLLGLEPVLRQIHGALSVVGFSRPAELVRLCQRLIEDCARAGHPTAHEDMDWIAEGLSSIGFFLDPCLHGRQPADEAVELFFERFEQTRTQPAPDVTQRLVLDTPTHATDAAAPEERQAVTRPGIDPELLEVFFEEADEVLAGIEAAVPKCRQGDDREALVTIRRGFHTLKGSGRMVGLMDLGEVAWEIEQVMNGWLERMQPASTDLLDLISTAAAGFSRWLADMRAGRLAGEVDAASIIAFARCVKRGETWTGARSAPETPAAGDAPADPFEVTVGNVHISRALYEVFMKEAGEHVARLEAEYAAWRAAPPADASHELMRAAHTLASSSLTAGFESIALLAGALEQWMPVARHMTVPADAEVVQAVIEAIRSGWEALGRQELPQPDEAAEQALRALVERLKAPSPPPLPEMEPVEEVKTLNEVKPVEVDEVRPIEIRPAAGGGEKRVMRDDIDDQLLPIFLEEARELVPQMGGDLRDWKTRPEDEMALASLQRALHTFKGSARMAGAIRLGELTHLMESRIEQALDAKSFTPEMFAELEEKMDRVSLDVERMSAGQPALPDLEITQKIAQPAPKARVAVAAPPKPAEAPLASPAAMLRVNADTLDHLINGAGEVAIARSRVEAELRGVKQTLADLSESVARMRGQLREVEVQADSQMQSRMSVLTERDREFDPLEFDRYTRLQELTRLMAESLNDINSIQQGLLKNVGETDAALVQQARTSRDVQQELMRMRAVPFATLGERLYRIVRQVSRELGKQAELEIEGAEIEIDRSVLERIGAPLEHMLRNAVGHGLEAPQARAAAGKPETGRVLLTLRQESNEIALVLADDGAGLDLERLVQRGRALGLVPQGHQPPDAEAAQLIFASGLSTADEVTQLSGRGVGMDVVRSEIAAIGGRVDVASVAGQGATFTIYLPLTLAVTQAVLVRSGSRLLAMSSAMVEQVLRLKGEALRRLYTDGAVQFQERRYPLHSLHALLGGVGSIEIHAQNSVLLLRSGVQRIALHVDELVGNQEIVVKNIGPQLALVPWIAGATVLPDGGIVLIANPVVLAQQARAVPATLPADATQKLAQEAPLTLGASRGADDEPSAGLVMVVDDSLTVRKITSRLLEREGYEVLTAKDGLDALEQMQERLPGVLLVDIEMPRMDGFDLTRNLRGDARTRHLPIIIISSRTAEKHRAQAAQLGVNAFLGKPYEEGDLLNHIARFLAA
jgi:chemosensory pili system protein ChpA (sensor histidine kinase/response regulator)